MGDDLGAWLKLTADKLKTLAGDIVKIQDNNENDKKNDMKSLQQATTLYANSQEAKEAKELKESDPDAAFIKKMLKEIFRG